MSVSNTIILVDPDFRIGWLLGRDQLHGGRPSPESVQRELRRPDAQCAERLLGEGGQGHGVSELCLRRYAVSTQMTSLVLI